MLEDLLKTELYSTQIPGIGVFRYKLLSIKEYRKVSSLRRSGIFFPDQLEEEVFKYCYIGNTGLLPAEMPAGITVSLGKLILFMSGDCDTKTIVRDISSFRKKNPPDTLHEYMRAVVTTAFPMYSLEDIDSWTRIEFIEKFSISENVLRKKQSDYEFLDLSKIGKQPKKKKKASHGIDFAAENAAMMKNQNPMDVQDAYQSIHDQQKNSKLSKDQARNLDKRRR